MTVVHASSELDVTVVSGSSVHSLIDLSLLSAAGTASGPLGEALDEIGDGAGETWLHLLGACVDLAEPRSITQLIGRLEEMAPVEFRLMLLGYHAWSWRSIVGADTIAAAARGDSIAKRQLLSDDRYYGRSAANALSEVLSLGPAETKHLFLHALNEYQRDRSDEALAGRLDDVIARVKALCDAEGWMEAVETLTGYRYVAEPEARRVVVMPHLVGRGLVLAQHDDARLIVFGERLAGTDADRVVELGSALSDGSRVELLRILRGGSAQLGHLVAATGLSRSTVHHHLRALRNAGLVAVEGNARAYRYSISRRGRSDAMVDLATLLGVPEPTGGNNG